MLNTLNEKIKKSLVDHLSQFVTPNRQRLISNALDKRTNYLTVVLEDIYQSQNASAVLRTCDCLGIQNIHVIENKNEYTINPDVALGSTKWIDINHYNEPETKNHLECIKGLKAKGFKIVATMPNENDLSLWDLDVEKGPYAFVFGNEKDGISPETAEQADHFVTIPMFGFTESYNISVSAAIILSQVIKDLNQKKVSYTFNDKQKLSTQLQWFINHIKQGDKIANSFLKANFTQ